MPVTLQAKTDITGLTPGTTDAVRVRPVLKAGEATWTWEVGSGPRPSFPRLPFPQSR
jgi:hypothetical protein